MPETVVMVTSSYPRFPGDSVGTFMEPIAHGVARLGHEVHVVAPWHPLVTRPALEHGVRLHFYRYAPFPSLNVFGYAAAMRADVSLKAAAFAAAPLALAAGWRAARQVARRYRATVMHGHWVVPGGITAALAAPGLPLVISLHGSDVFVAERLPPARLAARTALGRAGFVTACSADLASRAVQRLGADAERIAVVPYGVDTDRFKPDPDVRVRVRQSLDAGDDVLLIAAAGRLVRKKGFEYLLDALPSVSQAVLALAGSGTLEEELLSRARALGIADRVRFLGNQSQDEVSSLFAAADIIVTPSVRDDAGNVDGLPNVVLEALASRTPLITTTAGGIGAVVEHGVTAEIVPERDAAAIASALRRLQNRSRREELGTAARRLVEQRFGWTTTAEGMDHAYRRALAFKRTRR
jgi:glycosyltransferase involved in cell wall biosynthesis